jgi:arabinose-5-phosphate isomerase
VDNAKKIIDSAARTLQMEADAVSGLITFLDEGFVLVVSRILRMTGRVIFTGIGKSANIANKLVATFNSTGTPAVFMHAADAIHGDLGLVQSEDVVICISKSGNSPEIKALIPLVKNMGNTVIGMVGNTESFLAKQADHILNTTVSKEACPNNLAPTTSTTAQLALGDALAVCLMEQRGFTESDFAKYHPGGALGKRLYLRMKDLVDGQVRPSINVDTPIRQAIITISEGMSGAAAVLENNKVVGIVTDGDLRRMLQKGLDLDRTLASDIMSGKPKTIEGDELAVAGFHLMESNHISQLIVVEEKKFVGIVHLHQILKEGIYQA